MAALIPKFNRLKTMLSYHGLTQLVDVPAHRCGQTLDWAVVRSYVSRLVVERVEEMPGHSDHKNSYVRWRSQHQAKQSELSHLKTPRLSLPDFKADVKCFADWYSQCICKSSTLVYARVQLWSMQEFNAVPGTSKVVQCNPKPSLKGWDEDLWPCCLQ